MTNSNKKARRRNGKKKSLHNSKQSRLSSTKKSTSGRSGSFKVKRKAHVREKVEALDAIQMEGVFDTVIPEIQHALLREHYELPTPVQSEAIPPQVAGDDLFGSAQTGTGKTAAFTIPLLQELAGYRKCPDSGCPRALIMAPTRELAAQIGESISTYGHFLRISNTVIYGGVGQRPQEEALDRGVDILVATPGRLLDLMRQGFVDLSQVKTFILDEADRMLDMGFIPDIEKVVANLPEDRRNGFFSATVPKAVEELAGKILVNPVQIKIDPEKPTLDKIDQRVLFVDPSKKDDLLIELIRRRKIKRAIVFVKMKYRASRICDRIGRAGISSEQIHGNKSQAARNRALDRFKQGKIKVLVATDIAARGIDVNDITDVFNYDLPVEAETYVHRIGRTARAGAEGHAWSFCSKEDIDLLSAIERIIKRQITVEIDHNYHRESILNMVRNLKTSRRKRAQKRNKTKETKRWALKKKPRLLKELSGGGKERTL